MRPGIKCLTSQRLHYPFGPAQSTRLKLLLYILFLLLITGTVSASPIFDTHIHYDAADAEHHGPQDVIDILDKNRVPYAAVTGSNPVSVTELYQHAPARIVPVLSIYRRPADKKSWTRDTGLPQELESELRKGDWRAIGELHIFADERKSLVFRRIIEISSQHKLPVLIHGDPAVIDTVYTIAPGLQVIWAHAGTFPYPDLIADYLRRYPRLTVDLSMRDERFTKDGEFVDAWYELFITYPGRFLVGVDTDSSSRWENYAAAVNTIRSWLALLPADIADRIARINAEKIYGIPIRD